jgi:hypothetical protein
MSMNVQNARRHVELAKHRETSEQRIKELTIAFDQVLRELDRLNLKVAKLEGKFRGLIGKNPHGCAGFSPGRLQSVGTREVGKFRCPPSSNVPSAWPRARR